MIKLVRLYLFVDILLAGIFLLQGDLTGLLNSQVAAVSAGLIGIGSYLGYRQAIRQQVENLEGEIVDEQDMLDKIDDTYELFDDEAINDAELTDADVKRIFAEEKVKVKQKSSIKNIARSYKGIFSPLRLFAYGFLIFGFFWLEGNGNLAILPYLLGLSVLPATAILAAFTNR